MLSALGELLVDEAAEFGWSLTSMPLSWLSLLSCDLSETCWLLRWVACWVVPKLIGFDQALIAGAGAGAGGRVITDTGSGVVLLFTIVVVGMGCEASE